MNMQLPPRVSGYEIATLEVKAVSATDIARSSERSISVTLETETDSFTLLSTGYEADAARSSLSLDQVQPPGTPSSITSHNLAELEWEITRPIRLAVEYRQSCSVLISFVTKSSFLKKKRVIGLAALRLDDCPDGETSHRTLPIFATSEVKEAMHASASYWAMRSGKEPSRSKIQAEEAEIIGFISISFLLHPGVSRVHRRICKRDLRFKHVYEAWEVTKELNRGEDRTSVGDMLRATKSKMLDAYDSEESESEHEERGRDEAEGTRQKMTGAVPGQAMLDDAESEDGKGFMTEHRAHAHALHKRVSRFVLLPRKLPRSRPVCKLSPVVDHIALIYTSE